MKWKIPYIDFGRQYTNQNLHLQILINYVEWRFRFKR